MKKKMKDGGRYFRQRDILRPLGAAMTIGGVVWFYFGWSMASYYIPGVIVPVGLVLFFVAGSRIISDKDFAEQVEHALLDYDKCITDRADFARLVVDHPAPVELSAYAFDETATCFKKGKNGTPLSDRYARTHIFHTREGILVAGRRLTLSDIDDAGNVAAADFELAIPYRAITSAAVEEHKTEVKLSNTGKTLTVKWCELVLTVAGEGEILRVPVHADMDADNLCDYLNRKRE